ncbi:Nuclear-pore anchor [Apostasia shenzhenica]|uniref:Nuclear-pore anchor n=1 Tax=Apostasia shenzhenica TaxID=1088818 RepID=A0A2H9ZX58_9ASPA|nr:Nuclear-pore anchor [Apostasia shenzhenica]
MSLFLSEEEFRVLSTDASAVAERADAFIRDLRQQLDVVRAEAEAKSIAVEQNCALYEQRHSKLLSELSRLQSENAQLSGSAEERISELAVAQAEKHQLLIRAINKDGEIERLSLEAAEIQKSKRQLLELVGQKDSEILERDATIQSYLDKIVQLTEKNSLRESKLHEIEAELARCQATCTRVTQEKELLEKQNIWLDEELTAKVNSLVELRRKQMDVEIEMSGKITDLERQVKEYCTSLQHSKERVKELELRVKSLEEDLFSSKDIAAANEEHLNAELSTVNKLVELYKESSEEWSKKAGELEGVIKALEMHLSQVVNDYKEKLEKELFLRKNLEKEAADFKIKLEKCEDELENTRKNNEWNLLPLSRLPFGTNMEDLMISETGSDASNDNEQMIVPRITAGISGTALAASLLRDGWSLTKMYEKYQEASDALRHEKWGRKHAEAVLERVLHEIEERAKMILEERAEHEGMIDAYAKMNEKLQQALLEHDSYEHSIRKLKAELTRQERENDISQREINDLQKQVTVLLKECQDIQLRCSDNPQLYVEDSLNSDSRFSALVDPGLVMTEHHLANLTFKGINELVEQNVKLRGLVHRLSADLDKKEAEMRDDFRIELERASVEAASKVEVVLKRSEEQTNLIESLHSAVAMYKKLYEEEQKIRTSSIASARDVTDDGKKELMRPFEGSQGVSKKAYEKLSERARILEEDLGRRMECNAVSARNMELTHLLVDYQKRLRESSDSLQASEENSRKLSMEVSILKHEREILASSEKRASDEIRSLMERVHRLQSSLDTIQCAEELRENARAAERRKHDDYLKRVEREWADVKKELLKEKDHNRNVTAEKERAIETCMRQVEDIRKELAEAWHAVTKAEKRAAVAEDRYSELEAKVKYTHTGKQVSEEPWNAKEELEKMKEEARASKEYMLQAIKMKKALEYEVESFKKQVVELERNYMLKCEEVACTIEAKETALTSTMTETSSLRDEVSEKLTRIGILEIQISSLQSDLDKEHKRWRIAQDNYERQELLKSSWEMEKSVLQDLQKEAERKYAETDEQNKALHNHLEALHVRLAEKEQSSVGISSLNFDSQGDGDLQRVISYLRRSKEIAETEITLLKQERMRLQSKVFSSVAIKVKSFLGGLNQLEGALSASESAQSLLRSQLEKSRELLLRDDEFKSLQLQVREINLLRESNVQLREENRHNFEECQKFREEAKKAKAEAKSFEHLLQQKQVEGDAFQKDTEQLKIEIDLLNSRNSEILESYRNIDIKDYERMKDELEQTKESVLKLKQDLANCLVDLSEREKKLSDFEKIEANLKQENERQNRLFNLSKNKAQMLTKEKEELNSKNQALATEMEALKMKYQALMKEKEELNNSSQLTTKEKEDLNAKSLALAKEKVELVSKIHALSKEMEEMNSKNQALLKQLEELKSGISSTFGKKVSGEMTTEQAKKEQEKDTRIQILEKTLERERDDHRKEKQMRKKTQGTMIDLANRISLLLLGLAFHSMFVVAEASFFIHELRFAVVLNLAWAEQKTGVLASQLPSESSLDEQTSVYFHSLSSFEAATNLFINETEVTQPHPVNASVADNSVNSAGQLVPTQQTKVPKDHSKSTDEREKISAAGKPTLELRKPGRRIVRPSLEKPVELTFDSEISAAETSMSEGKASSSHEHELSASIATAVPTSRKRLTSSELETLEGSVSHAEVSINDAPPLAKRLKESEFEEISDTCDVQPSSETFDRMPHQDVPQPDISQMQILQPEEELEPENVSLIPNEEVVNLVKEEEDIPVNEETEEHEKVPIDAVNLNEVQYGGDVIVDEPLGEGLKGEEIKVQDSTAYGEAREEGELMTEEPEQQPDDAVSGEGQLDSVTIDEADDAIEIASLSNEQDALPIASEDTEKTTCSINDQGALDPERSLELSRGAREESPTSHLHSVASVQQTLIASSEEASESQVSRSSRTISIAERARQNAQLRQAGIAAQQQQQQQQSPQRGRGRVVFRVLLYICCLFFDSIQLPKEVAVEEGDSCERKIFQLEQHPIGLSTLLVVCLKYDLQLLFLM